ncbi:uncharacterized protein LOC128226248 [Mya arenaria]|uniref:uncharacterized protein LOC128226248 n=1 Tax=Mya arenaria TaxID=6604 RepID=UPI0022E0DF78|nr:uncharacterized protein LOC128226248 [Mya arenaria]
MVVTTTGYIVSVLGPYVGKNNDASILNHIVNENVEEFRHWIQEDDIAVVDRGFRDAVQLLKDLGVKTEMPSFLGPKEKQFKTNSANHSRLVTKIRWVVESANGRLKNWKYLEISRVIPNSQIPYAGDYTRIVAAICNKYRSPLIAGNDEDDLLTAARLISMSRRENLLQARVEEEGLDHLTKSSGWALLSEPGVVPDFSKLDESDLRTLTVGVYQLKLAPSYVQEHLDEHGNFDIFVREQSPGLLCIKIQSRHMSAIRYKCWVGYNEGAINGWYCKCKSGARVVGMCAHITAVVWHLSYQRHDVMARGVRNWTDALIDTAEP